MVYFEYFFYKYYESFSRAKQLDFLKDQGELLSLFRVGETLQKV